MAQRKKRTQIDSLNNPMSNEINKEAEKDFIIDDSSLIPPPMTEEELDCCWIAAGRKLPRPKPKNEASSMGYLAKQRGGMSQKMGGGGMGEGSDLGTIDWHRIGFGGK